MGLENLWPRKQYLSSCIWQCASFGYLWYLFNDVGSTSVCYVYDLLPMANKEAALAYGRVE